MQFLANYPKQPAKSNGIDLSHVVPTKFAEELGGRETTEQVAQQVIQGSDRVVPNTPHPVDVKLGTPTSSDRTPLKLLDI